eukprot:TRINITY_DN10939_c0_g4_i1.p1 TRINITY_DN10939_c0_g4~~TRINITY_DN10939_c0_g4_i1.p1  ORF type:complete len:593 (-),score=103.84 TRINITY_DN10939_c0_g4_i1:399-2177(-)
MEESNDVHVQLGKMSFAEIQALISRELARVEAEWEFNDETLESQQQERKFKRSKEKIPELHHPESEWDWTCSGSSSLKSAKASDKTLISAKPAVGKISGSLLVPRTPLSQRPGAKKLRPGVWAIEVAELGQPELTVPTPPVSPSTCSSTRASSPTGYKPLSPASDASSIPTSPQHPIGPPPSNSIRRPFGRIFKSTTPDFGEPSIVEDKVEPSAAKAEPHRLDAQVSEISLEEPAAEPFAEPEAAVDLDIPERICSKQVTKVAEIAVQKPEAASHLEPADIADISKETNSGILREVQSSGTNVSRSRGLLDRQLRPGMIDPMSLVLEDAANLQDELSRIRSHRCQSETSCSEEVPQGTLHPRHLLRYRAASNTQDAMVAILFEKEDLDDESRLCAELDQAYARQQRHQGSRNWRGLQRPPDVLAVSSNQDHSSCRPVTAPAAPTLDVYEDLHISEGLNLGPGTTRGRELGCSDGLGTQYSCCADVWWKSSVTARRRRQGEFAVSTLGSQQPEWSDESGFPCKRYCDPSEPFDRWPSGRPLIEARDLPDLPGAEGGKAQSLGLSLECPSAQGPLPSWLKRSAKTEKGTLANEC